MTTPIIEDSGSSIYTYQGNNFNQLTINGKEINYFRDENPAVDQNWRWNDLFNLWDNLVATRSAQNPNILKIENTLRLTSDPSDNIMRDITATSNPATLIDVSNNLNDNSNYFLNMSLTAGLNRVIYVNDASFNITYNPSLGQLNAQQFDGAIHSQANNANQVHYLTFVDSASNSFGRLQKTSGLSYNPNSGNLSATRFIGDVSGNATSATNSSTVSIINADVNSTYYPVLASGTGNIGLTIDSVTTPLTYNPNTATLTVGNSTLSSTNITSGTGTITTRLNLSYASSTATFSSGTLTLNAGATRSFQSFTYSMTGNITAMTFTNLGQNGSFNLFLTGHATTDYTIAVGGSGGLGASISTSWATTQTITAGSRNLITIHYDSVGDRFYLRGTFALTG